MRRRRLVAGSLATITTVLLIVQLVLTGDAAGPLLVIIPEGHGLHDTDLVAFGMWVSAVGASIYFWRTGA